jgi:hypothetical protein
VAAFLAAKLRPCSFNYRKPKFRCHFLDFVSPLPEFSILSIADKTRFFFISNVKQRGVRANIAKWNK